MCESSNKPSWGFSLCEFFNKPENLLYVNYVTILRIYFNSKAQTMSEKPI